MFGESKVIRLLFDNSQRNNLRSGVWVRWGSGVDDVRADFSPVFREKPLSLYGGGHRVRSGEPA